MHACCTIECIVHAVVSSAFPKMYRMQVEVCRLADLPDLDQSNSFVRNTLKEWVGSTVSKYGFDGLRVDTSPEVPKDFWSEYSQSAGVFTIGEVFNGDPDYVSGYQGPLDATLNYPMYYKLKNAFQSKDTMQNIHDGVQQNSVFRDVSVLGNFLDNHDNKRFLNSNGDTTVLKNGLAYIIFAEVWYALTSLSYSLSFFIHSYHFTVPCAKKRSVSCSYTASSLS